MDRARLAALCAVASIWAGPAFATVYTATIHAVITAQLPPQGGQLPAVIPNDPYGLGQTFEWGVSWDSESFPAVTHNGLQVANGTFTTPGASTT